MKELVGKLSREQIEYDLPQTDVSVVSIDKNIEAGLVFSDSFEVFDKKGGEIKGIIYSTNEYVKVINNQFCGKKNQIEYTVDTSILQSGDEIHGRINIVSNGGEIYIPFKFRIKEESIPYKDGNISNLFHFVNLVKQDYDEALKLFLSEDFENVILKDQLEDICMYRGLVKNSNKKRALEEFMIAINKKEKVEFDLSEHEKNYEQLQDSYGDFVLMTKSTWGIIEIEAEADADFITEYKNRITEEDFAGTHFEFHYLIDGSKLHAGMNYGKITFRSPYQTAEFVIIVDNRGEQNETHREIRKSLVDINKIYLDFRMRRCSVDKWAEVSQKLVEHARGFDDSNPFLRLFQAQVYISKKDDENAKWLIDSVTEQVMQQRDENIPLYCYYLYIKALHKRELEYTLMITETIRKFYESGYDKWEILWILIYIDTSFENNKSLKLARIKEQFNLGCRSTLMYYEALYALNRQPMLLRVVNNFELQVLNFGSKYDAIDLRLAIQLSEVSMHEKTFRPILFRILVKLYQKFENKVILNTILSMLIRCNRTEPEYFPWYELGVKMDVQITSLYEYYVRSMPLDFAGDIPETVLLYFVYNHNLLGSREAFFYTLLIRDKDNYKNSYKTYQPIIETYALDMLKQGRINQYIAVVYKEVLTPELIMEENEKMLSKVLNTWALEVHNPEMREAIVLHKEVKNQITYPLVQSRAFVEIYTDDAIILFRDGKGNIYLNTIDYKLEKLLESKELNEIALKKNSDNVYVMARECEQSIKYHKQLENGNELFEGIMADDRFNREFKDYILQDMIEYYLDHFDGDKLDDYLRSIDVGKLNRKSRIAVTELMIMRGLYLEAIHIIGKYGIYGMDERKILKLCTYVIRENVPCDREKLIKYCEMTFKKGKYNESSLELLLDEYNGTTKEMLELWRVSKEFDTEDRDLEERIIAQMLFSKASVENICSVYDSYSKKGSLDMIKKAYLFYNAYVYFVQRREIDTLFFHHLEDEINTGNQISDLCKCAFLLFYSKKKNIKETTKELCKTMMDDLENKNIIFDFYKKYKNWFKLSGNILDKTTIEYRCRPVDKVMIHYYIENDSEDADEYEAVQMREVFHGLYTKSFTLFYGEKIHYYIMETVGTETTITDTREHILDDRNVDTNTSRYGRLNDLLMCKDMREENTIGTLATDYYIDDQMVKQLFNL